MRQHMSTAGYAGSRRTGGGREGEVQRADAVTHKRQILEGAAGNCNFIQQYRSLKSCNKTHCGLMELKGLLSKAVTKTAILREGQLD